jgi:hypothetical protein
MRNGAIGAEMAVAEPAVAQAGAAVAEALGAIKLVRNLQAACVH